MLHGKLGLKNQLSITEQCHIRKRGRERAKIVSHIILTVLLFTFIPPELWVGAVAAVSAPKNEKNIILMYNVLVEKGCKGER